VRQDVDAEDDCRPRHRHGREIVFDGVPITALPPGRRGTAMMFQSYALFPHLSVLDNVAFALKMRASPGSAGARGRRPCSS